jgi:WD40 repeat protein
MPPAKNGTVFLSYARKDGREAALHLKRELEKNDLTVWMDMERIEGGANWSREIEEAINGCEVLLGLLTPGSYESEVCRAEQMRALRIGKCVIPIRVQTSADKPLYLETKNWRQYPTQIPEVLADIAKREGATLKPAYRQTRVAYVTMPVQVANHIPRPEAVRSLRETLIAEDGNRAVALTAIEGMGGIGKTVLAQDLCRDEVVQAAFPDGIVWVTVGRERQHPYIDQMREIAKAVGDDSTRFENDLAAGNQYRTTLKNKAALIVLDDVWNKADLDPFLAESQRSRFLFTTRDATIARFAGAREHRSDLLDEAQAVELLSAWSGFESQSLPASAREIVHECGRLPLALATMGALLRTAGLDEWQDWLDRLKEADLSAIESVLPPGQASFFRAIDVSVEALKPEMRTRYEALAVLLQGMAASLPILQTLWNVDAPAARLAGKHVAERSLAEWNSAASALRLHDLQLDYVRAQYPDRDALDLIHGAVRLSSNAIEIDPRQFAPQMVGRLLPYADSPTINRFTREVAAAAPMPWLRPLYPALHPPRAGLLRTLEGHSSAVTGVAVTADGQWAVSTSDDNTLKVWELESGQALRTLEGHSSGVTGVALAADGKRAVSASLDTTLKVWDLESGQALRTLEGHSDSVTGVAVMADGRRVVSASLDKTLKVWDLESGQALRTLDGHSDSIYGVALTADGKRVVAAAGDSTLKVWDLESGQALRTLEGHSSSVTCVALTADGKRAVSASRDRTLKVWDLESGQALRTLQGHLRSVNGVAVTADGKRAVSASRDHTLKVWDLESGQAFRTLEGHSFYVNGVIVTADGKRAISASGDHTLKVWDLVGGQALRTLEGHSSYVNGVAVTADGKRAVSASGDRTLKVWDLKSGQALRTLEGHSSYVNGVAVTTDGKRAVSASYDKTLKVWDLESGQVLRTLEGHSSYVNGVAVTTDGKRAVSASYDSTLKVWDLESGRALRTVEGHSSYVYGVAVTTDGNRAVLASSDGVLTVWDLESGQLLRRLGGHASSVYGVAVAADGKRAVLASSDGVLTVWDPESGQAPRRLEAHASSVYGVAVAADGKRAVSASGDRTLKVWDLETGKPLATFHADAGVRCCAFAGEKMIVAGDDLGHLHVLVLEEKH